MSELVRQLAAGPHFEHDITASTPFGTEFVIHLSGDYYAVHLDRLARYEEKVVKLPLYAKYLDDVQERQNAACAAALNREFLEPAFFRVLRERGYFFLLTPFRPDKRLLFRPEIRLFRRRDGEHEGLEDASVMDLDNVIPDGAGTFSGCRIGVLNAGKPRLVWESIEKRVRAMDEDRREELRKLAPYAEAMERAMQLALWDIEKLKKQYFGEREYSVPGLKITTKILDDAVHIAWENTSSQDDITVEGFSQQSGFDGIESPANQIVSSDVKQDFTHHRIPLNTTHYYLFRRKGQRAAGWFEDSNVDRTVIYTKKVTFTAHVPDKVEAVRQKLAVKSLEQQVMSPAERKIAEREEAPLLARAAVRQQAAFDVIEQEEIAATKRKGLSAAEEAREIRIKKSIIENFKQRQIGL